MGLVLKLYCAPEQVSYIIGSVSQRLHRNRLQKYLKTITTQTLVTISKNMNSAVVALSAVQLWHFSQEFHEIVAAVWNLSKAMEQYQIFSGNFLANLGQYSFTVKMSSLIGRW